MANVLTMAKIQSIQQLHAAGWSQRRIAEELDIDRGTVGAIPTIVAAGLKTSHSARRLRRVKCSHFFPLPAPVLGRTNGSGGTVARRVQMPPFRPPGFRNAHAPAAGTPSIRAADRASASRSAS